MREMSQSPNLALYVYVYVCVVCVYMIYRCGVTPVGEERRVGRMCWCVGVGVGNANCCKR